ncbi:diacylglycerol kinase family lipid kinase [Candidatus Woesearchaeota archaeon]|nr:diacylglycerol kinase family lipid kinase [Candidatus Woesearchaeota archaeon]
MRYLLLINPYSGKKNKEIVIEKIKERFSSCVDVISTEKKGDALLFAKGSNHDIIITGGGDGTINEVINGIMLNKQKKQKPTLAILPLGTSNMFARSLGLTGKSIEELGELIASERSRNIDVGKANERYFVIASGIGFDAHAYHYVQPQLKRMVGEAAYPISLLKTMIDYKPQELSIDCCGKKRTGYFVLVCNVVKFHKFFTLIKEGNEYDGQFDVLVFQKKNLLDNLRYLYGVLAQKHHLFKDVEHIICKELTITSKTPVLNHTDAEDNGTTPVKITMFEKAIKIIC